MPEKTVSVNNFEYELKADAAPAELTVAASAQAASAMTVASGNSDFLGSDTTSHYKLQARSGGVRYTEHSDATPTATFGILLAANGTVTVTKVQMDSMKFIQASGAAQLYVQPQRRS